MQIYSGASPVSFIYRGPDRLWVAPPSALFAVGGVGLWLDPSKRASLSQDSAGSVPVTAAGQPVGRILDQSGGARHATQSTSAARPTYQIDAGGRPYLYFDAVDDWLSTAAFDWGSDAVTLVLALRKRSDTDEGTLLHFGDFNSTPSFLVGGPGGSPSDKFFAFSRGTTRTPTISTSPAHSAPLAAVVTMQGRISTDTNILRINGVQVSSAAGDQGASASYGVQQMFIGRRGGTVAPAQMDLYGLMVINRLLSPAELALAEAWAAAKQGVTF